MKKRQVKEKGWQKLPPTLNKARAFLCGKDCSLAILPVSVSMPLSLDCPREQHLVFHVPWIWNTHPHWAGERQGLNYWLTNSLGPGQRLRSPQFYKHCLSVHCAMGTLQKSGGNPRPRKQLTAECGCEGRSSCALDQALQEITIHCNVRPVFCWSKRETETSH